MEAKIPITCVSIKKDEYKKFIDLIRCPICGGVFFEPIFLKLEKSIVCKNCFFNKYKINNIDKIDMLFEKIDIKNMDALFKFNFLNSLKFIYIIF